MISALKDDHRDSVMSNVHNLILDMGKERFEGEMLERFRSLLLKTVQSGRREDLHEDVHHLALELELPVWNDDY